MADDFVTFEEAVEIAREVCREECRKRFGIAGLRLGGGGGGGGSGGGSGSLPAASGGSGALYNSIQNAIDSETGTSTSFVPQAGTAAGQVVLPAAMSAPADGYKDYYVVDTDTTPTNGLVYRSARVAASSGSTLTLDQPWDFSAEASLVLVQPARVSALRDTGEALVITKPLELNLSGHRVRRIDITGGDFCWVRGGGWVNDGVQMTSAGFLRLDGLTVSRRGTSIYALLLTNGSDLGRCEVKDCEFNGRVAARRGRIGWGIWNCTNVGVVDGVQGIPWALMESVAGVAIVPVQLDCQIESEFSGAIAYSENSLVGTAYLSVQGGILASKEYLGVTTSSRRFAVFRAVGSAVLTWVMNAGSVNLKIGQQSQIPFAIPSEPGITAGYPLTASFLAAQDFSGTASVDFNNATGNIFVETDTGCFWTNLLVEGATACSGTVIVDSSGFTIFPVVRSNMIAACVTLAATLTAAANINHPLIATIVGGTQVVGIYFAASQNAAATVTLNGGLTAERSRTVNPFAVTSASISISAGTYSIAGVLAPGVVVYQVSMGASVTGGSFTISGTLVVSFHGRSTTLLYQHGGTGGTITISASQTYIGGTFSTFSLARCTGAGGILLNSGNVVLKDMNVTTTTPLVDATTATSTARFTGTFVATNVRWTAATTWLNATALGGSAEGPSSMTYNSCTWELALTDRSGAGSITWAAVTLVFNNSVLKGAFTFTGTSFTVVRAYETTFEAGIVTSGVRPSSIYSLFRCTLAGSYLGLTPDIVETWFVLPSAAALARGQLVEFAAGPTVAGQGAGTINAGVVLYAVGGAGLDTIVVQKGRVFVNCAAGVVAANGLKVDVAGVPTQAIAAALGALVLGQTIGTALEAVGATVANQAYSEVGIR